MLILFREAAFLLPLLIRECGSAALFQLICWPFITLKEVKGGRREGEHVGEVQIESEGLSFVFLLREVQFGFPEVE